MKYNNINDISISYFSLEIWNEQSDSNDQKIVKAIENGCIFFDITNTNIDQFINNKIPEENKKTIYLAKRIRLDDLENVINEENAKNNENPENPPNNENNENPPNNENNKKNIQYFYYIDIHEYSSDEIVQKFQEIKQKGPINNLKWGISNAKEDDIDKCNNAYTLTFVKNDFSILNREYEKEIEKLKQNYKNVFFFASSPFCNIQKGKNLIDKFVKPHFEEENKAKNKCCGFCNNKEEKKEKIELEKFQREKYSLAYIAEKSLIPLINIKEEKEEHYKFIELNINNEEIKEIEESIRTSKDKKLKKFLVIEYVLNTILMLVSLIEFGLSFLGDNIMQSSEIVRSISNDLIDNFNTGYFMSFRRCPTPYEHNLTQNKRRMSDNLISFGRWEGMKKGCGKNGKDGIKVSLINKDKKNCEKDEQLLQPISARELYIYKGISLCAVTKGNYYDLIFNNDSIIKENEDCPEGKKLCGYIDTMKNKLCFDKDKECPINYVSFSESRPKNISNLQVIEGKGINLYYSNNPYENENEIPYVTNAFKIFSDNVCSLPDLYHSNIDLFALDGFLKEYADNCVINKDFTQKYTQDFGKRYHKLNQINNYDLYKENQIIDDIEKSELINYGLNTSMYNNNILNLYVRTHYGFDKECLKKRNRDFNIKELGNIFSTAEKMKTFVKYMLLNIVSFVTCFYDLVALCRGCEKLETCCKKVDWTLIVTQIMKGIVSIYDIISGALAVYYDDDYENDMTCSDFITNDNYNIMIYQLKKAGKSIEILVIFIVIFSVLQLVSIIILIYMKCELENSSNDIDIYNKDKENANIKKEESKGNVKNEQQPVESERTNININEKNNPN